MNSGRTLEVETDETFLSRDVSCRVTNSLIKYLELEGYDISAIIEGLPYSKKYLTDPLNWVPFSIRETMAQRAADLSGDKAIMYKIGLATPRLKSLSGVEHMILRLGGPKLAYRSVPKYATMFESVSRFKVTIEGDNKAMVAMSLPEGHQPYKSACYYD